MKREAVTAYKKVNLLTSIVILSTSLMLCSPSVLSAPFLLDDTVMHQISAGIADEGGGVIVGNNSDAVTNSQMELVISDEAQQGAKGLNIVNSTNSAVANTVNIWDGNSVTILVEDSNLKPVLEVNQLNQVTQTQSQSAILSGYSRADAETTKIINHYVNESYTSDLVNIDNLKDFSSETRYTETSSSANVNTKLVLELGDNLYIEGHLGQGVASSGYVKAVYDGGSAEFILGMNAGISVGAELVVANDILGTSASVNANASLEAGLALITKIELPRMELELSGAGCGVIMGSCAASGSNTELVIMTIDKSSQQIFDDHQTGQSAFTEEYFETYRSSFELDSARADYIVIDDSQLELESEITLELSGSAQKEIEGLNIVNAIGSNVANSTNVSRVTQFKTQRSSLILNQFNVVHHGH